MKKIIIFIFVGIVFSFSTKAQVLKNDIFTPKGSPVVTYQMTEATSTERAGYDSDYISTFPNATPIYTYPPYSSTKLFNCHGYAWLKVEGGPDRWIGLNSGNRDPDVYMTDGSYIEVPNPVYPGKVFYTRPSDHSAVTTANNSNIVISKWNQWPLMKHALGYGPNFGSSWKFYKLAPPAITGPLVICGSGSTFSVTGAPTGFTWGCSSKISISGSGNTVTVYSSSPVPSYPNPVSDVLYVYIQAAKTASQSRGLTSQQPSPVTSYYIRLYNDLGVIVLLVARFLMSLEYASKPHMSIKAINTM